LGAKDKGQIDISGHLRIPYESMPARALHRRANPDSNLLRIQARGFLMEKLLQVLHHPRLEHRLSERLELLFPDGQHRCRYAPSLPVYQSQVVGPGRSFSTLTKLPIYAVTSHAHLLSTVNNGLAWGELSRSVKRRNTQCRTQIFMSRP
jgi:hypothetical protein